MESAGKMMNGRVRAEYSVKLSESVSFPEFQKWQVRPADEE